MAKIQARQGVGALYKGLLSNLMATSLYGITVSAIAGLFDINEYVFEFIHFTATDIFFDLSVEII